MGLVNFIFFAVWIIFAAEEGSALKCYVCTTTSGLPGNNSKTSGCSPGEPMNQDFLKECDRNDTHCNTHKMTARLSTTFGILTTVAYQLRCSPSPLNLCERNVYNLTGVEYSEGCHKSCQTDGCNSLATSLTRPTNRPTSASEATSHPALTESSTSRPNGTRNLGVLLGSIAAVVAVIVLIVIGVVILRRRNAKSSNPPVNSQPPTGESAELTSRKPQDSAPPDSVKYESINTNDAECDSEGYLMVKSDDSKLHDSSPQYKEISLQETSDKVLA